MSDLTARIAALSPEQRDLLLKRLAGKSAGGPALPDMQPDPAGAGLPFPQTYVQEAYLAGRSGYFDMGACGTNFFTEFEVTGGAGPFLERFQGALRRLIARHDSFRTVMLPDGQQQILADPRFDLPVIDLREAAPTEAEARLEAERHRMKYAKASVDRWPLFEFIACLLADGRIRILSRIEALILDGTSNSIWLKELFCLLEEPEADLAPYTCSFRDYVLALEAVRETDLYARSQRYWLERVKHLPPAPEFPLVQPPSPLVESRPVGRAAILLDPAAFGAFKARAARAALTPSAVVLAALAEVIAAWAASPRFTISLVASYRLPFHPEVQQMVGNFNSITLLGVDATGGSFTDRARRLQTQLSTDLEHMYFPGFKALQAWNRLQGAGARAASPVLANSLIEYSHSVYEARQLDRDGAATPDGSIAVVDAAFTVPQITFEPIFGVEPDGSLSAWWVSLDAIFPPGLFDAMFAAYQALLRRLATDDAAWAETSFAFVEHPTATSTPPAMALTAPPGAAAVRRHLETSGAVPGDVVAMLVEPGVDAGAAIAGTWAAGCAFLPLDPAWPETDLQAALEQAGAGHLLGDLAPGPDEPLDIPWGECLVWRPGRGLDRFGPASLAATVAGLSERLRLAPGAPVTLADAPPASDLWLTGTLLALATGCTVSDSGAEPSLAREERGAHRTDAALLGGSAPGVLWSLLDRLPLPGFQVHVTDPAGAERPHWVPGELRVNGARTGCRVRRLPGGTIETVWPEVRVRGYRVSLRDVEEALLTAPGIRAALCTENAAYVLGPATGLQEYLRQRLPGYMVPPQIIALAEWPRTLDGRVDFGALPLPAAAPPHQYDSDLERQLAEIWAEVLGSGPVETTADLFTLGATSLTAIRLIARVEKQLGRKLPFTILADDPTVRGFARVIGGVSAGQPDVLVTTRADNG